MTPVEFHFILPNGLPLVGAAIEIQLSASAYDDDSGIVMPTPVTDITDADGKALVELAVLNAIYHVVVEDPNSEAALHYRFLVPELEEGVTVARLQDIVVDAENDPQNFADATLVAILAAKANALSAAADAVEAVEGAAEDAATAAAAATTASAASAVVLAARDTTVAAKDVVVAAESVVIAAKNAAEAAGASAVLASNAAQTARQAAEATLDTWSPTAPVSPRAGAKWINSNTGRAFTWVVDEDSSAWVETGAVVVAGSGPGGEGGGSPGVDGEDGLDAYQLAVAEGFVGTRSAWLASLKGAAGDSAYLVAVQNGFVGSQAAWLASLEATDGEDGTDGLDGSVWLVIASGVPSNLTGKDLDMCLVQSNLNAYQKQAGAWVFIANLSGAAPGPTNSAPVNTVPSARTTPEDTPLGISGVTVADIDGQSLTSTLTVTNGTLSVSTGLGATVTGNGTSQVVVAGTTTQINQALAGLTFTNTKDFHGSSVLTITTSDGTLTDTDTVQITITPVADVVFDTITTAFNTPGTINVLSNDSFEDTGRQVTGVTQPATGGSVTFQANGSITFTPNNGYSGVTSFTYNVLSAGLVETGTVNVTVNAESQGGALPGDIVDVNGAVVQAAYIDTGLNFSDPAKGLTYRFGAPATATGVVTLPQRPDSGSILYGSGVRIYYQLGGPESEVNNDFVSNDGAVAFRPNTGTSVANAVARFRTYAIDRHTVIIRPQPMWTSSQLFPPQVQEYINAGILSTSEPADLPVVQYRHVGPGDGCATRMSLFATQGSATRGARIFTVGTETAQQRGTCILAPGKIPTAMSVTNDGAWCFVTVWDINNFKGQVVVIALGSVPMNRTWQDNTNWYDWWHDWLDMVHPGFKNQGGWAFQKVMGYYDLPANMKAPTCVHAYTGLHPFDIIYNGNDPAGVGQEASPMESNRARLLNYDDLGKFINKGGLLVVGSKSEKTVCFIDLAPLISYVNGMYLNSAASNLETQLYMLNAAGAPDVALGVNGNKYLNNTNGDVFLKTAGAWNLIGNLGAGRGLGMANNQWPYQLADHPEAMPVLIKTVTLPEGPVGITAPISYNYWSKDNRRLEPGTPYWMNSPRYPTVRIVSRTTCYIFSAGRWVPGSKALDQAPNANEIAQIGTIANLGEQITCVTGVKDFDVSAQGVVYNSPGDIPGCLDEMMLIVDRKNRALKWVQFTHTTNDGGTVVATLADSRMDPTWVDHVDGYHKSNKVVLVADYSGHCVRTYRVNSPTVLTYDGVAYQTLHVDGEYGGQQLVDGIPFQCGTSNTP